LKRRRQAPLSAALFDQLANVDIANIELSGKCANARHHGGARSRSPRFFRDQSRHRLSVPGQHHFFA
jgi:hypothetical protein